MKKEKANRKATGAAVAMAAGLSLLLGGLFQSPADLAEDMKARASPPPAIEMVLPDNPDDGGDGGASEEDDALSEEKRRGGLKSSLRTMILRLPVGVRAAVCVPIWIVGHILITFLSAVWSSVLSPVMGTIVGWFCIAGVLIAAITGTVKTVFPDVPIKKILNRRNILTVITGVAFIAFADAVIPFISESYVNIRTVVRITATGLLAAFATVSALRNSSQIRRHDSSNMEVIST